MLKIICWLPLNETTDLCNNRNNRIYNLMVNIHVWKHAVNSLYQPLLSIKLTRFDHRAPRSYCLNTSADYCPSNSRCWLSTYANLSCCAWRRRCFLRSKRSSWRSTAPFWRHSSVIKRSPRRSGCWCSPWAWATSETLSSATCGCCSGTLNAYFMAPTSSRQVLVMAPGRARAPA